MSKRTCIYPRGLITDHRPSNRIPTNCTKITKISSLIINFQLGYSVCLSSIILILSLYTYSSVKLSMV